MLGRFGEAVPLAEEADAHYGGGWAAEFPWAANWIMAEIAALADDHETASRRLTAVCEWLKAKDLGAFISTYEPLLGRELCALGRYEEAEETARLGREVVSEQDVGAQALWRQVQARVHASRNEHADAERLAHEAVRLLERTDGLKMQGDALSDLAEVLEVAGRREDAIAAWQEALDCYERKQIIPLARRLRERLAAIQDAQA
jgi:tetratricopeptide (TPR) repeat protein